MIEANTELRFLDRLPRPKFLPHGSILENQRKAVGEFFQQKAEFAKSHLLPKRPFLERFGSIITTYVGAAITFDGWRNLGILISTQAPASYLETEFGVTLATAIATLETIGGAATVMYADEWKKKIWQRDKNAQDKQDNINIINTRVDHLNNL